MSLAIQETKTHAGTRKLPMTADVEKCFRAIIEDRMIIRKTDVLARLACLLSFFLTAPHR